MYRLKPLILDENIVDSAALSLVASQNVALRNRPSAHSRVRLAERFPSDIQSNAETTSERNEVSTEEGDFTSEDR
jgi:hypothetical protein